mmetsp:Transcript_14270/g.39391  ORF Transcript_14270/g.39391 Transcript_14270/m.39391 type:complete len:279 (-) Transcript_14270:721-1557(-)
MATDRAQIGRTTQLSMRAQSANSLPRSSHSWWCTCRVLSSTAGIGRLSPRTPSSVLRARAEKVGILAAHELWPLPIGMFCPRAPEAVLLALAIRLPVASGRRWPLIGIGLPATRLTVVPRPWQHSKALVLRNGVARDAQTHLLQHVPGDAEPLAGLTRTHLPLEVEGFVAGGIYEVFVFLVQHPSEKRFIETWRPQHLSHRHARRRRRPCWGFATIFVGGLICCVVHLSQLVRVLAVLFRHAPRDPSQLVDVEFRIQRGANLGVFRGKQGLPLALLFA